MSNTPYPDYYDKFNWFSSDLLTDLTLRPVAGTLIPILDACLVTGVGLMPVQQITVAGGTATIHTGIKPVALEGGLIELSGISGTHDLLNGSHRVEAVGTNTITILVSAPEGTVPATGVTVRIPPLGWEKLYVSEAGTTAVYRSLHPKRLGYCLRVRDTAAIDVFVTPYESMSDVNTGVNGFSGGEKVWWKSVDNNSSNAGRRWAITGDSRLFMLGVVSYFSTDINSQYVFNWSMFGDLESPSDQDFFNCVFFAPGNDRSGSLIAVGTRYVGPAWGYLYLARGYGASTEIGIQGWRSFFMGAVTDAGFQGSNSDLSGLSSTQTSDGGDLVLGEKYLYPYHIFGGNFYRGDVPRMRYIVGEARTNSSKGGTVIEVGGQKFLFIGAGSFRGGSGNWGSLAWAIDEVRSK